jgi:hypothetical protein
MINIDDYGYSVPKDHNELFNAYSDGKLEGRISKICNRYALILPNISCGLDYFKDLSLFRIKNRVHECVVGGDLLKVQFVILPDQRKWLAKVLEYNVDLSSTESFSHNRYCIKFEPKRICFNTILLNAISYDFAILEESSDWFVCKDVGKYEPMEDIHKFISSFIDCIKEFNNLCEQRAVNKHILKSRMGLVTFLECHVCDKSGSFPVVDVGTLNYCPFCGEKITK